MKKAFMRGVCALNLEAMSMFREGEEGGRRPPPPAAAPNSTEEIASGACLFIYLISLSLHKQMPTMLFPKRIIGQPNSVFI